MGKWKKCRETDTGKGGRRKESKKEIENVRRENEE
jgi:hypothetical protein